MRRLPLLLSLMLFGAACASHDGREPDTETPVTQRVELRASIASVQLAQNCPDPAAAPASADQAKPAAAMPPSESAVPSQGAAARMKGDSNWSPPCTQSTVQLTIAHDGNETLPFEVKAMRLTQAGQGGVLASVPYRGPQRWVDSGSRYETWDEKLAAKAELKVSYKLGEPDWSLVSKAIGSDDTYGKRYVLEVDVSFAGRTITLRSPEFEREYPHVVVT
ncbi:MAG TPA: hypothetical protein VG755_24665 [Nannocystaceae bacterium]|nr:hypothetical protein [Nannocystaceae bacterium]